LRDKPEPGKPLMAINCRRRVVFNCTVGDHKLLYSSCFKSIDADAGDLTNLEQATFTDTKTVAGESSKTVLR
jgi:hypothetical protein